MIKLVNGKSAPGVIKQIKFDRRGFQAGHKWTFDDLKVKVEWVYSQKQCNKLTQVPVEQIRKEQGDYTSNHSDKITLACIDGLAKGLNIVGHIRFPKR